MATGVGKRIKEARLRMGLTQEELANKMCKTKYLISKVENGLDNLTLDKVAEYAEALNVSPSYLMGWTDIPKESISHIDYIIDRDCIFVEQVNNLGAEKRLLAYAKGLSELIKCISVLNDKGIEELTKHAKLMTKADEYKKEGDSNGY